MAAVLHPARYGAVHDLRRLLLPPVRPQLPAVRRRTAAALRPGERHAGRRRRRSPCGSRRPTPTSSPTPRRPGVPARARAPMSVRAVGVRARRARHPAVGRSRCPTPSSGSRPRCRASGPALRRRTTPARATTRVAGRGEGDTPRARGKVTEVSVFRRRRRDDDAADPAEAQRRGRAGEATGRRRPPAGGPGCRAVRAARGSVGLLRSGRTRPLRRPRRHAAARAGRAWSCVSRSTRHGRGQRRGGRCSAGSAVLLHALRGAALRGDLGTRSGQRSPRG